MDNESKWTAKRRFTQSDQILSEYCSLLLSFAASARNEASHFLQPWAWPAVVSIACDNQIPVSKPSLNRTRTQKSSLVLIQWLNRRSLPVRNAALRTMPPYSG